MSRALFLRHGESAHNAHRGAEMLGEDEGDLLTERGVAQARAAAAALRDEGVTQLLCSPMRRARETAAALEAELGLKAEERDYVGEWRVGEGFSELLARVRRLRAELEAEAGELSAEAGVEVDAPGQGTSRTASAVGLPLLVGHGIFFRVFLLDLVLGEEVTNSLDEAGTARAMERIWRMGSHNCGLSVFARGESRYPGGAPIPGWTCLTWMARPWDPP
ncbi:MAG: histidine phosphatase family protein [Solirubrobacterales bacterium]